MKPYQANILTAIILIIMGGWGYAEGLMEGTASPTALIPVGFGVIFLLATYPFKRDNKVVAHIVVVLTFLLLIALVRPLTSALNKNDSLATVRVVIMMAACIFALVVYIKNFIDVRKARKDA